MKDLHGDGIKDETCTKEEQITTQIAQFIQHLMLQNIMQKILGETCIIGA